MRDPVNRGTVNRGFTVYYIVHVYDHSAASANDMVSCSCNHIGVQAVHPGLDDLCSMVGPKTAVYT